MEGAVRSRLGLALIASAAIVIGSAGAALAVPAGRTIPPARVPHWAAAGQLHEVPAAITAEGAPFSRAQLGTLLDLAESGIRRLHAAQADALLRAG